MEVILNKSRFKSIHGELNYYDYKSNSSCANH